MKHRSNIEVVRIEPINPQSRIKAIRADDRLEKERSSRPFTKPFYRRKCCLMSTDQISRLEWIFLFPIPQDKQNKQVVGINE
mmetsp:Transcript_32747/g.79590  ORF Transcript_32747/g.79590 Transcript_32747/m.79590 type:complete len:82 (+) Transcript_32747:1566-1811(+)